MAKPAHTRVTFEGVVGTVGAPLEYWAFGVNFPEDAIPPDATDVVADGVALSLKGAYTTHWKPIMGSDVILTKVKVSRIQADGTVEKRGDGSYIQGEWTGSDAGTQAKAPMPLQVAVCVGLSTTRSGATGKGRFFIPWPSGSLDDTTKRISSTGATNWATAAKNFLNALATVLTFPPQVVSSKGYMSEVTGVRVGRVPDTLRSRRADLPEEYVSVPLA